MDKNSAVDPDSRARKPRPLIDGSSKAEEARNAEHSINDLPYCSGSMKGNIPPESISSKNSAAMGTAGELKVSNEDISLVYYN